MNLGFQAALSTDYAIDRGNRRLAFVVRGMLASTVLIAGNAISRKFFGVASSTAVIPAEFLHASTVRHRAVQPARCHLGNGPYNADLLGAIPFMAIQLLMVGILAVFPGIATTQQVQVRATDQEIEDAFRTAPAELSPEPEFSEQEKSR